MCQEPQMLQRCIHPHALALSHLSGLTPSSSTWRLGEADSLVICPGSLPRACGLFLQIWVHLWSSPEYHTPKARNKNTNVWQLTPPSHQPLPVLRTLCLCQVWHLKDRGPSASNISSSSSSSTFSSFSSSLFLLSLLHPHILPLSPLLPPPLLLSKYSVYHIFNKKCIARKIAKVQTSCLDVCVQLKGGENRIRNKFCFVMHGFVLLSLYL